MAWNMWKTQAVSWLTGKNYVKMLWNTWTGNWWLKFIDELLKADHCCTALDHWFNSCNWLLGCLGLTACRMYLLPREVWRADLQGNMAFCLARSGSQGACRADCHVTGHLDGGHYRRHNGSLNGNILARHGHYEATVASLIRGKGD